MRSPQASYFQHGSIYQEFLLAEIQKKLIEFPKDEDEIENDFYKEIKLKQ